MRRVPMSRRGAEAFEDGVAWTFYAVDTADVEREYECHAVIATDRLSVTLGDGVTVVPEGEYAARGIDEDALWDEAWRMAREWAGACVDEQEARLRERHEDAEEERGLDIWRGL